MDKWVKNYKTFPPFFSFFSPHTFRLCYNTTIAEGTDDGAQSCEECAAVS